MNNGFFICSAALHKPVKPQFHDSKGAPHKKSADALIQRNPPLGASFQRRSYPARRATGFFGDPLNYYYRYLGDYLKDTLDLSALENGVYNFLLDSYYATEKPIQADKAYLIARASTKAEKSATDSVLKTFFKRQGGAWVHSKCEAEIAKARKRIKTAQENGAKHRRTQEEPSGLPSGIPDGLPNGGSIQPLNLQSLNNKNPEAKNGLPREESQEVTDFARSFAGSHRVPRG